jgi:hypothetical protein
MTLTQLALHKADLARHTEVLSPAAGRREEVPAADPGPHGAAEPAAATGESYAARSAHWLTRPASSGMSRRLATPTRCRRGWRSCPRGKAGSRCGTAS